MNVSADLGETHSTYKGILFATNVSYRRLKLQAGSTIHAITRSYTLPNQPRIQCTRLLVGGPSICAMKVFIRS